MADANRFFKDMEEKYGKRAFINKSYQAFIGGLIQEKMTEDFKLEGDTDYTLDASLSWDDIKKIRDGFRDLIKNYDQSLAMEERIRTYMVDNICKIIDYLANPKVQTKNISWIQAL